MFYWKFNKVRIWWLQVFVLTQLWNYLNILVLITVWYCAVIMEFIVVFNSYFVRLMASWLRYLDMTVMNGVWPDQYTAWLDDGGYDPVSIQCTVTLSWGYHGLWQQESCGKMEWTLPEATQRHCLDHEARDKIRQRITKTCLDEILIMDEMARAIAGLKDGKAPGGDGISAEVWKHGGDNLFSRLHLLITNACEVGSVPQAWKGASIVTIYKKGDRTDCGNYRGISLLSIAGKIFVRILLNRLSTHIIPEVVPET